MRTGDVSKNFFGLNIEGGDPYLRLASDHKQNGTNFLWANLILVLDRPFVDNIVFEKLWNDNRFVLLEPRIDNLNEHHFMAAFLMVIRYYLMNCHELLRKNNNDHVKITIHLHQDPSRRPLLHIIETYLKMMHSKDWSSNVEIEYLTDTDSVKYFKGTSTNYANTDILISLSQCAGLSEEYIPGTLHIADTFVPFSNNCTIIEESKRYRVNNDLSIRIDDIIASHFNEESVQFINMNYKSENPIKEHHKANLFTKNDFPTSVILQVDGIWNPTDPNELIKVE